MILNDLLLQVKSYNLPSETVSLVDIFFTRVQKCFPLVIEELQSENVSKTFENEVIFEWFLNNQYVSLRIDNHEVKLESKTQSGRFFKHHPVPYKVVNSLVYCLQMMKGQEPDATRYI